MPNEGSPTKRNRLDELALTLPSLGWLLVFFAVPTIIVLVLAFKPADATGGVGPGWTFENLKALADPQYSSIAWRTLWITGCTSLVCVALALPVAFGMARATVRWKNLLLLLMVIPFWTNFLIRVFAWKSLLHPDGLISSLLDKTHLFEDTPSLLYNNGAVLLIMIYTLLPFAILPLYAAAEKFDFTLLEAARDLGATRWRALTSVFVPGVSRGIGSAAVMVFVSALGMYVVPDIVGGTDCEMLGNKITQRLQGDRNLPLASALAAVMLAAVVILLLAAWLWQKRQSQRSLIEVEVAE
jgi:spermidine/putrescine transport system permease protein